MNFSDEVVNNVVTQSELEAAIRIWRDDRKNFHERVRDEVITPNIIRISEALGQTTNPDALAYAVEYAMRTTHVERRDT